MLRQFSRFVSIFIVLVLCFTLVMVSCKPGNKSSEPPAKAIDSKAERFDLDLVEHAGNVSFLRHRYGSFFELYTYQITQLGTADTTLLKDRLLDFISDPDISAIEGDVKKAFPDFSLIDRQLSEAFSRYNAAFPAKILPRIVTFISGFSYAIVCADSVLGIGLDMYLGSDSRFYPSLEMPEYKIRRMRKEYIAADALRGWAQSDWVADAAQTDLISQMVYQGKIQYFLSQLMPETPDSVKFGYTQRQLEWCEASEKAIWSFFIDKQLLFVTDASQIGKFVNDGPTTNGFPREAPGNIGAWIGFRIVRAYMEKYPSTSLAELMELADLKKIFRDSNYKPAR